MAFPRKRRAQSFVLFNRFFDCSRKGSSEQSLYTHSIDV